MTIETKEFPRAVVWSVISGIMCCRNFSDIHECIEHMAGKSVWTHQIPYWSTRARPRLEKMFPELVAKPELTPDTYDEWRSKVGDDFLDELIPIQRGCIGGASGNPPDDLPEHATVLAVKVEE